MNNPSILILLCIGLLLECSGTILPKFPHADGPCNGENLPVLIQPEKDILAGNGLLTTYCKSEITPSGVELRITYVFQDEIHPNLMKDFFYRIYRRFKYGRTADIESIRVKLNPEGNLSEIDLTNVYSSDQIFLQDPVEHYDSILKPTQMEFRNLRPVLFVNTWNHMFGEKDTNPDLPKMEILGGELRYGSRELLESYFKGRL
ncbi:surface adhesion protein Lsa23 [Leptospira inadai]|uniref:Lipoprotein n=1 Tax=Leptospira inadai serovar Lyme TaxID=293084 RepID=A0ABX4YKH4_9LEPT|nr:hypothetical protein [Leptospira inadai]PNV75756.1 hypothetical protein BES34_006915 [Leptospira inadai serovar Lyme]